MNINIMTPINQLGYGVAGTNIVKSLSKKHDIALWITGNPEVYDKETIEILRGTINNSLFYDYHAPCVKIWHQHDMAQFAGRGTRIGFPFFELDEFAKHEIHSLNSLDKIFVTSRWAKDIVLDQTSITDVHVVPLGVDTNIFKPSKYEYSDKTIFFNCGKWEIRKGHDILVNLFNRAFEKEDNVELWMMCSNPFISPQERDEWEKLYINSKLGDKIKILPRVKTHEEVYNIMSNIDCGVFPSRAEGWNLELLECMSCGKQVITTNYSAHTEFCNQDNSHLVSISEKELAYDGKWFQGQQGFWAKINQEAQDSFIEYMRHVHNNKSLNIHGIETGKKFTWSNSTDKMVQYV